MVPIPSGACRVVRQRLDEFRGGFLGHAAVSAPLAWHQCRVNPRGVVKGDPGVSIDPCVRTHRAQGRNSNPAPASDRHFRLMKREAERKDQSVEQREW
jgi:hypothetical protein